MTACDDMDGALLGERINSDAHLSRARIVMLTSLDRQGDVQRFASLGFAAYLTKPVRARELFECLDRVLARDAREWHLQSQPIITHGALAGGEAKRRYQCRVLLVEDNAVNQKVAVRLLERMGCSVRVADNGAEGLSAFSEAQHDIVFMDLQMPVMDGLTATRRIRELERAERRTPIIALTANAMSGQLERCTEAGMDGFLTKPIDIARLSETLDRYGLGGIPATTADATPDSGGDAPIDVARLNELTAGDMEFAARARRDIRRERRTGARRKFATRSPPPIAARWSRCSQAQGRQRQHPRRGAARLRVCARIPGGQPRSAAAQGADCGSRTGIRTRCRVHRGAGGAGEENGVRPEQALGSGRQEHGAIADVWFGALLTLTRASTRRPVG